MPVKDPNACSCDHCSWRWCTQARLWSAADSTTLLDKGMTGSDAQALAGAHKGQAVVSC